MGEYIIEIEKATSVKRIGVIKEPTDIAPGKADMIFLPVFSVFDYGTIKPPVPLDNSTICLMGGYNFELLQEHGIDSHYHCLVTDKGEEISAKDAIAKGITPTKMRVRFVNRVQPEFNDGQWDYSMFTDPKIKSYVHPVEFISRNKIGKSSSVWKRVERGEITFEDLGLPADFKPGDPIPEDIKPILDCSTKFEKEDRYPPRKVIQAMLGLSDERFAGINFMTIGSSNITTDHAAYRGFDREDGKVEYITYMFDGAPKDELADNVCTWHEDRLLKNGLTVSKQRIRDEIKKESPEWVAEIDRAKKYAQDNNIPDFTTVMNPDIRYNSPSPEFFHAINTLFRAGTNHWVDTKVYPIYPQHEESLDDNLNRAIDEFRKIA